MSFRPGNAPFPRLLIFFVYLYVFLQNPINLITEDFCFVKQTKTEQLQLRRSSFNRIEMPVKSSAFLAQGVFYEAQYDI